MSDVKKLALAAICVVACAGASAGDADKKTVVVREEKVVRVRETKKERSGGFTGFWIHTVGGTIGNGLKSGASKIEKTFN